MPDRDFLATVAILALVCFGCRAGGYLLMRFVPATPRIQAALRAVPLAAMIGIVMPTAIAGQLPEGVALGVVGVVMRLGGNELAAAVAGLAVVAAGRSLGY